VRLRRWDLCLEVSSLLTECCSSNGHQSRASLHTEKNTWLPYHEIRMHCAVMAADTNFMASRLPAKRTCFRFSAISHCFSRRTSPQFLGLFRDVSTKVYEGSLYSNFRITSTRFFHPLEISKQWHFFPIIRIMTVVTMVVGEHLTV
jgi:hypothetical protein